MEQIVDIQEMKIVNAGSIKQTASHSCHIYFRLERNSTAIPSPRLNSPSAKRFAKCGFKKINYYDAVEAAMATVSLSGQSTVEGSVRAIAQFEIK